MCCKAAKNWLIAVACSLLPAGIAQADLSTSDANAGVAVSLRDAAAQHAVQSKYRFDHTLRAESTGITESTVTTSVTPLTLPGDFDTSTAIAIPTAPFNIGDGSLLDGSSATTWPSGRYTESTQSWIDAGGSVTGGVAEVPLPASVLLALIGLGIAGVGRTRFAHRG